MIGNTILSGVVDHSCLVHLDFRGRPAVRRISHSPTYGVVVQTEVVLTAVECPSSHPTQVVPGPGVEAGVQLGPLDLSSVRSQCLGVLTTWISLRLGDDPLGDL